MYGGVLWYAFHAAETREMIGVGVPLSNKQLLFFTLSSFLTSCDQLIQNSQPPFFSLSSYLPLFLFAAPINTILCTITQHSQITKTYFIHFYTQTILHGFFKTCAVNIHCWVFFYCFCSQLLSRFWYNLGRWSRQDTKQWRASHFVSWQILWLGLPV